MKVCALPVVFLLLIMNTTAAQAPKNPQLVDMVTRMARIGRASSPSFSPDGKRMAFVSDSSGIPQVWIAPIEGGASCESTRALSSGLDAAAYVREALYRGF